MCPDAGTSPPFPPLPSPSAANVKDRLSKRQRRRVKEKRRIKRQQQREEAAAAAAAAVVKAKTVPEPTPALVSPAASAPALLTLPNPLADDNDGGLVRFGDGSKDSAQGAAGIEEGEVEASISIIEELSPTSSSYSSHSPVSKLVLTIMGGYPEPPTREVLQRRFATLP